MLAASPGVSQKLILEWVNQADLARINGIGWEYGDLLEEASIDTVPELVQRNTANLHAKLSEINAAKSLCTACHPPIKSPRGWPKPRRWSA